MPTTSKTRAKRQAQRKRYRERAAQRRQRWEARKETAAHGRPQVITTDQIEAANRMSTETES